MSRTTPLDMAIFLAHAGYAVHWCQPRRKAPILDNWAQVPRLTPDELRATYRPGYNLGVRCGHWSTPQAGHGLVIIDVDIRAPQYQDAATEAMEDFLPESLEIPVVLSGRGMGRRHLRFACPVGTMPPKANVTLAQGPDPVPETWKLEVLSTGKQVVCPPSIHPETGRRYQWAWPALMPLAPPVMPQALLAACTVALDVHATRRIHAGQVLHGPREGTGERPGDLYNRQADWRTILEPHGWVPVRQRGGVTDWRRPGKREGISATTNYADSGLLYVFTTNAAPFGSDMAYSPFAAYTLLDHGGDFQSAAREVGAAMGRNPTRRPRTGPKMWQEPACAGAGKEVALWRA